MFQLIMYAWLFSFSGCAVRDYVFILYAFYRFTDVPEEQDVPVVDDIHEEKIYDDLCSLRSKAGSQVSTDQELCFCLFLLFFWLFEDGHFLLARKENVTAFYDICAVNMLLENPSIGQVPIYHKSVPLYEYEKLTFSTL